MPRFAARYRAMRSRWNEEWWSIVFGGPIANLLNAAIAEVRWITPNALTLLGFALRLAGCALVVARWDVAAIAVLQASVVLDCMDGTLARYRGATSHLGAFLDKLTDAVALLAVLAAAGWRAYAETGDAGALVAAQLAAGLMVVRFYAFWVVAGIERATGAAATAGVDQRIDFTSFTPRQRARRYAASQLRLFAFAESDLYFWIAVGLVTGRLREVCYGIGAVGVAWFAIVVAVRLRAVHRMSRDEPVRAAVRVDSRLAS